MNKKTGADRHKQEIVRQNFGPIHGIATYQQGVSHSEAFLHRNSS